MVRWDSKKILYNNIVDSNFNFLIYKRMPREIITIQIGQCGNQSTETLKFSWELVLEAIV